MEIPTHIREHIEMIARHEQEFYSKRPPAERLGDIVARFAGNFSFVIIHVLIFGFWMAVNVLSLGRIRHFDPFPFSLLSTLVGIEAILLASFILMRQSGLAKRADERDHLMLQVLLLTEREVSAIVKMNQEIANRLGLRALSEDEDIQEMAKPTPIETVAETIQQNLTRE